MPFSGSQRQLTFVFQFAVHTPALEFGRKHYLCGSSFRYPLVHGSTVSRLVHFKHDATTARQRHLSADEVQMCRMRCHTECTESRFQCFNADDALKFRVIRSWGGCNANHILWLNDVFDIHRNEKAIEWIQQEADCYDKGLKTLSDSLMQEKLKNVH